MSEADVTAARPYRAPLRARALLGRLELGDAVLLVYLAAFARQYSWWVDSNPLAWALVAAVSAPALWLYVSTREARAGTAPQFWLVVALPLLFVYALRVPFPDVSFDVLNYRLLHGERALGGPLFMPGDFFPSPLPFNPSPDIVTGIFRRLLGYRLGTVVNLLAMLWAAQVVDRFLRPHVRGAWLRSAGVLLVVLCEHTLFVVNNYMVDLLALPLILEAAYLTLRAGGEGREDEGREGDGRRGDAVRVAFLLGAAVAFKLTNLSVALALAPFYAHRFLFKGRPAGRRLAALLLASATVFLLPLLPYVVYIYMETGSPVFPVYNGLFKSPYWTEQNWRDPRWGPTAAWQTLVWPVVSAFKPARLSELGVYSGRLALGFVAALAGLALVRRDSRARLLCLVVLIESLLWSATTGYVRYALHLELLGGVLLLALAALAVRGGLRLPARLGLPLAALLCATLAAQAAVACSYAARYEWSMRPTFFTQPAPYRHELRFLLRDHSLVSFLSEEERAALAPVEAWVESGIKTNGMEALLRPGAPIVNVRQHEYFTGGASARRFAAALDHAAGEKFYSLCFPESLKEAQGFIESRGLKVVGKAPVTIPFYSPRNRIGLYLIEAERGEGGAVVAAAKALQPDAYRARITVADAPESWRAGEKRELLLTVKNLGGAAWPARGTREGRFQVNAGDRWLDARGETVVNDLDARTVLPRDLGPGEEVELRLGVTAPKTPGEYVLEIDMVHEGVTWFYEKGSETLRLRVRVQ